MKSLPLALLLAASLTGCGDLAYRGASPNVRTFSEEPALSQYYIGWDVEFAVVDPPTETAAPATANTPATTADTTEIREPQPPVDTEDLPRDLPAPRFLD